MRRIRGLGALVGLLAIVAGVPAGLIGLAGVAGVHLPHHVLSVHQVAAALSSPDTGQLLLGFLLIVAWLAWAVFTVSITAEVLGKITHRAVQVPGLGKPQRGVHGLVVAAAMLFVATPLVATATAAGAAPAPTPAAATASPHPGTPASSRTAQPSTASTLRTESTPTATPLTHEHIVKAGETLWSIARDELGDGARAHEIARLNYGITQPGGGQLREDHWIDPGWILKIPGPASSAQIQGAHRYKAQPGDNLWDIAEHELGAGRDYPQIAAASAATVQPGGAHLTDPDKIDVGWDLTIPAHDTTATEPPAAPTPAQPVPAPVRPAPHAPPTQQRGPAQTPTPASPTPDAGQQIQPHPGSHQPTVQHAAASDDMLEEFFTVRNAVGVGAILAAGVLGLIGTRRTIQQRRRRPGATIPMPTGEVADTEQDLRAIADPFSVELVDRALRTLARHQAQAGQPLPQVRAARLTAGQFDLYLAAAAQLPAPWAGTSDGTVWTLPAAVEGLLDPEAAAEIPAPYPSLVTIGHDAEDGHVFLDLEFLSALGVIGTVELTREVLAAIAIELATSHWADDLQVTLVGAYPELEDVLGTGRIRYLPTAGHIIDELVNRAQQDRDTLTATGAEDLNHARATGTAPGTWTPEIVLLAGHLSDRQARQLRDLVDELPRVAIAAITSGHAVSEWALRLDGPEAATLEPIGLQLRPQRLIADTYARMLDMAATANENTSEADGPDDLEEPVEVHHLVFERPTGEGAMASSAAAGIPTPEDLGSPDVIESENAADVDDPQLPSKLPPVIAAFAAGTSQSEADAVESERHLAAEDVVSEAANDEGPADTPRADDDAAAEAVGAAEDDAVPPIPADLGRRADTGGLDAGGVVADAAAGGDAGEVHAIGRRVPRILVLGEPELVDAAGPVEDTKRPRLTELGACVALNPGKNHHFIDTAIWPNQASVPDQTRNTAMSKLRRWIGNDPAGNRYMPDYSGAAGYTTGPVQTDWHQWLELIPGDAREASTDNLEKALKLVRGRPFEATNGRRRRYGWAEKIREDITSTITDAAYELARRRLIDGRWQAAGNAAATGIRVDAGGCERLWRARMIAAYASGNRAELDEAIARLLAIVEPIGGELEPETEELIAQLNDPNTRRDQLTAAL